jgi:hypothetical protein
MPGRAADERFSPPAERVVRALCQGAAVGRSVQRPLGGFGGSGVVCVGQNCS